MLRFFSSPPSCVCVRIECDSVEGLTNGSTDWLAVNLGLNGSTVHA